MRHAELIARLKAAPEWMASNGKLESLLNEAIAALQAEPVPMTDAQAVDIFVNAKGTDKLSYMIAAVRAVEAFHNIKPKGE